MTIGPFVVSNLTLKVSGAFAVSVAGLSSRPGPAVAAGFGAGLGAVWAATSAVAPATRTAATAKRISSLPKQYRPSGLLWNVQHALAGQHRFAADANTLNIGPFGPNRDMHVTRAPHLHALQAQHRPRL